MAVKIAIALAVGMLVGFERESANKDALQIVLGSAVLAAQHYLTSR